MYWILSICSEKLYVREYTPGNIHTQNLRQGLCVHTALNTRFALLSQHQLCLCYALLLQILGYSILELHRYFPFSK